MNRDTSQLPGPLALWQRLPSWKRQLALVCIAQGIASIGWSFLQPFYPLFIQQELGVENAKDASFWAGLTSAVFALFMGVAGPFWGHLADNYGRKPMLIRAYLAGAIVLTLSGLITNVGQLIGVRILHGAAAGSVGAAMALAGSFTPSNRLPLAVGLLQFTNFFSVTISPIIGGQLVNLFGFRTSYFVSSGFVGAAGLVITFLIKETFQKPTNKGQNRGNFFADTREVLSAKGLLTALMFVPIVQGAPVLLQPVIPGFIQSITSGDTTVINTGLAFGVLGLMSGTSAVLVGRFSEHLDLRKVLIISCVGASLSLLPQLFVHSYLIFVLLFGLFGLFSGAMLTALSSIVGMLIPKENLGAAFGVLNSASAMGWGLGPMAGGVLTWSIGHRRVFLASTCILALTGLTIAWLCKGIKAISPNER